MKRYATFLLIACMSAALLFSLITRSRAPHDAPAESVPTVALGDGGDAGPASDASTDAADAADGDGKASSVIERPFRVTTLGWELAAPGVLLASVDGGAERAALELAPESSLPAVESRLARGGADALGADVAILPLPAFVQAYEHVRALEPRAFMVVGFSRGREQLHSAPGALRRPPPAADDVKLVGLGPATASDPAALAVGSESATLLGLFALDLLGVPLAQVRVVAPGAPEAKTAFLSAVTRVTRGAVDERKLGLSTADASRLIPIVAVAPKALLDGSESRLREFAAAWFVGQGRARGDASAVARRLANANKDVLPLGAGIGASPDALVILDLLGQVDAATPAQQLDLFGTSATSPATLEVLMQRTWLLARKGGLTSSAAPSPLPVDTRIVRALGVAPPQVQTAAPRELSADAGAWGPLPASAIPIGLYRAVDASADAASVVEQLGFLAAVFENSAFRISAKGGQKAARAIALAAQSQFQIGEERLATVATEPLAAFASVEILSLP